MAFEAFIPKTVNLQSDDALLEGFSWRRVFTVKKTVSGAETPVSMAEYDAVVPVIVFKNNVTEGSPAGVTTGCPVGVCAWTNAAAGEFQVDVTQANTNPGSQVFTGKYEIYVTHDTEEDTAGVKKRAMVFKGDWTVEKTVTAT